MNYSAAITYAERHTLHALSIVCNGNSVTVRTGAEHGLDEPHALYSGTKSFWGIVAAAAADDGLLDLTEPVAATLTEWQADPHKRTITLRQLLDLTSGFGFGGLGNAVPEAGRAIAIPLKHEPGTVFTYGGVPLQIFGEVLRRKLGGQATQPHTYLQQRVLDRIGMRVERWRVLRDGTHPLPTGAFVSTNEWLKFGALLLTGGAGVISPAAFAQCITPSAQNPAYGLGIWLNEGPGKVSALYASGAGGQGLYVLPALGIVAVHFGQSSSWNHAAFIRRLGESER